MITQKEILGAYVFLRTNNQSIPDEVLDFIKDAALEKLKAIPIEPPVILPKPNQPIFTIREVERMLADQRLSCMKQRYYYRYKGVKKMEEAILNAPPPQEFIDKIIVKIP